MYKKNIYDYDTYATTYDNYLAALPASVQSLVAECGIDFMLHTKPYTMIPHHADWSAAS